MGLELRRVPLDWEHPRTEDGQRYQPCFDETYAQVQARQEWEASLWKRGLHLYQMDSGFSDEPEYPAEFADEHYYRPPFAGPAEAFQVYENVSEGTPESPVLSSPTAVIEWMAESLDESVELATSMVVRDLALTSEGDAFVQWWEVWLSKDPETAARWLRYHLRMSQIAALSPDHMRPVLEAADRDVRLLAIRLMSILDRIEPPTYLEVPEEALARQTSRGSR